MSEGQAIVGTAGWSIPLADRAAFPEEGTSLERYAARFAGAEVNSSFHRRHRPATWARWAESVPAAFRFAVKLPKTITHAAKLVDCGALIAEFAEDVRPLGPSHAVTLVQLPPSLAFAADLAAPFFDTLRAALPSAIACEPRHPSWFDAEAEVDAFLAAVEVARVAADPARVEAAATPGGWRGLAYWRLHGSPVMYRSRYDADRLAAFAGAIAADLAPSWVMFDNTASSAATGDALALQDLLAPT